jgi:hypothetical protein
MPAPSAYAPPASRSPQGQNARTQIPFIRATKKHREPFFDQTVALNTAVSPINVPAYGFIRGIWIRADGGNGTVGAGILTGTGAADSPFNAFQFMGLFDVNGAPLIGPFGNSYRAFEMGKYGGYHRYLDGRQGDFALPAGAAGAFRCWWYLPIELVRRNALGSLANLNAAATYKLQLTTNTQTAIYGSGATFTVAPNVRIRCWIDAWAQPPSTDLLGNMTQQVPNSHGTTQFWSEQVYPIGPGQQTIRLVRVGLYIRMLICTLNLASGLRDTFSQTGTAASQAAADGDWPDPVQLFLDGFELQNVSQNFLWNELYSLYNVTPNSNDAANARDTSVYVFQFIDDDSAVLGNEERNRYLPTLQSSRLEIRGSFGATAGQLSVLTNDVAPQGDIFVGSTDNASI